MKATNILCGVMLFTLSEQGLATRSTPEQQIAEAKESEEQNQKLINRMRIDYNSPAYANSALLKGDGNLNKTDDILDTLRKFCINQGWGSNACGYSITQAQKVILSDECKANAVEPHITDCANILASFKLPDLEAVKQKLAERDKSLAMLKRDKRKAMILKPAAPPQLKKKKGDGNT